MAFNLADVLGSAAAEYQDNTLVNLDLSIIDEDERNFYELSNIDDLAANIELVGLMDPIRVRRGENGRYIVVSGHRRRAACMKLRDEGNDKFKTVPCIIESAGSEAMQELRLIFANNATRVISGPDMQKQAERVTELLYRLKEEGVEFPGRMSNHVAQACQISTSRLKRLNAIKNNLSAAFYSYFQTGTLNETAAYAISRLPCDIQEEIARKPKVINLAQKKDGISGMKVDEAIRRGAEYEAEHKCTQDKRVVCGHHIDRYAATICNDSWRSCPGGCCCNCEYAASCAYPCSYAKKQIAEKKAQDKLEREAAKAELIQQESFGQGMRRIRHFSQVCRLAELCDRAGIPDDENIGVERWSSVTAGAVRQLAAEGLPSDYCAYEDDYRALSLDLYDLEKLAEKLQCTVGELAGEEPVKESAVDTKNKWQATEDFPGVEGWYLMRNKHGMEVYYYHDGKFYWDLEDDKFGVPLSDFIGWAKCPED